MKLVLLDTSFLLLPFERGVDIFTELSRVMNEGFVPSVPQAVLNELEAMARGNARRSIAAKSALGVIEKKKIAILTEKDKKKQGQGSGVKKTADVWFVQNAKAMDAVVCTTDTELKAILRNQGVRVIILMDKSHLGFA